MTHPSAAADSERFDPESVGSWRVTLEEWLARATGTDGIAEPNAITLATADSDGRPSARTVLLKGIDDRGLVFFTNLHSRKSQQLLANPRAAITLVWPALQHQVLVVGDVEQVTRAETEAYARSRARGSQLGAWVSRQSQVIASRAVLEQGLAEVTERFEGREVDVPDFWGGWRVLPLSVEFWIGRRDRLHDRVRLRRADGRPGLADDDGWVRERLAP